MIIAIFPELVIDFHHSISNRKSRALSKINCSCCLNFIIRVQRGRKSSL